MGRDSVPFLSYLRGGKKKEGGGSTTHFHKVRGPGSFFVVSRGEQARGNKEKKRASRIQSRGGKKRGQPMLTREELGGRGEREEKKTNLWSRGK